LLFGILTIEFNLELITALRGFELAEVEDGFDVTALAYGLTRLLITFILLLI
jgi:hypothetical protein